ncbi:hypothetical protein AA313_de0204725 [Arthrobotrys entomopaga]|nr:hypothetical protein AA313_de0204725 [Arthrobotrys entomopaga]
MGKSPEEIEATRKKFGLILNQMRSRLIIEMLDNDPNVLPFVQGYGSWEDCSYGSKSSDARGFESLKHYLDYKWDGIGNSANLNMIPYIHNLNLSRTQITKLSPLAELCSHIVVLVNDIYSSEKEWASHLLHGREGIPQSGVFILMAVHDTTIEDARKMAQLEIVQLEKRFIRESHRILDGSSSAEREDLTKYICILQYYFTGAAVWQMDHGRYASDPTRPFYPKPGHKISDFLRMLNDSKKGGKKRQFYNEREDVATHGQSKKARMSEYELEALAGMPL